VSSGIAAAELDRRIAIVRPGALVDDGMTKVPGPDVEVGKRWARKTDASDAERRQAAQQGQELTTRFLVRWDSLTASVDATYRLVCEGVAYEVVATKEARGRRIGIEITAMARPDVRS